MNRKDFPSIDGYYYVRDYFEVNGSGWVSPEHLEEMITEYRAGVTDTGVPDGIFVCNIKGYSYPFYIRPEFGDLECLAYTDCQCSVLAYDYKDENITIFIKDRFKFKKWPYIYKFGTELFN